MALVTAAVMIPTIVVIGLFKLAALKRAQDFPPSFIGGYLSETFRRRNSFSEISGGRRKTMEGLSCLQKTNVRNSIWR